MGFQKLSLFLAVSILVLYQASNLQAAPFRSAVESSPDFDKLSEEEARLLLAELVKNFVQMKASEREQETESSSLESPRTKRCSNLSTCLLASYAQQLSNYHTFSNTGFGAKSPGKK